MSLPWSRTGRLLLPLILLIGLVACTTATASDGRPPPQRWLVLGERDDAVDVTTLAGDVIAPAGRPPARLLDLSTTAAGVEAVIAQQLAAMPEESPDLIVLRLGPTDVGATAPLSPERYRDLVAALLHTLRARAPVIVSTIPALLSASTSETSTLTIARRLRTTREYNAAIREAARLQDAIVVDTGGTRPTGAGSITLTHAGDDRALQRARSLAERARAGGRRLDVLAKVGDSITSSPAFLRDLGEPALHDAGLESLIESFRVFNEAPVAAGDGDSPATTVPFARESVAARDRWTVANVLGGDGDSPLLREVETLHAGLAVVMLGTNDLTSAPVETFEVRLDLLLAELSRRDVTVLLSTIPERRDRPEFAALVPRFNASIRALAAAHGVFLIDYHAAMATLPNAGLAPDGIHPSICPAGPGVLTPACLQYGYNLRNLVTLQSLDQWRVTVLAAVEGRLLSSRSDGR